MTGVALLHPVPSLTLYTDSSLQGWGAFLEGKSASGVWSLVQQQEHINLLEMRAVLLALQHFKTLLVSKAVVLATWRLLRRTEGLELEIQRFPVYDSDW
jgi:hypothetical protein